MRLDGGTTYTGAEVSAHFDLDADQAHLPRPGLRRRGRANSGRSPSSGSAASPRTSRSSRRCSTTRTSRRPAEHRVHREPPTAAHRAAPRTAAPSCSTTSRTSPSTARTVRAVSVDPVTKLHPWTFRCPPDGTRQLLLAVGPEEFARRLRWRRRRSRSPTPPSVTRTSRCSRHGSGPATCSRSPGTSRGPRRTCGASRRGAGRRPDVSLRFLSEDPLGAAGQAAPGGAEHLPPDAAARPQHGRLHAVPHRRHPGVRREPRPPGSTCSGSSTRSTTSSRCASRSRPCAAQGPRWRRWRCATPATCPTPTRSSTRSTTTSTSPSGSSTRACSRSRTWPGCSRPPPAPWSPRCATGSTCRCTCTHDTPGVLRRRCHAIDSGVDAVDAACAAMANDRPASALRAGRDHRPLRARDGPGPRRDLRPGAVLGGDHAGSTRRSRRACPRPGLHRDPRRAAVEPAPAGDRPRPRGEVRADRGHVRRGERHPRQHRQGDPVEQGGRRPRPAPGRGRRRPEGVRRGRASSTSPTP